MDHHIINSVAVLVTVIYIWLAVKKPRFALFTCTFTAVMLAAFSGALESIPAIVLASLLVPITLISIIIPSRPAHIDTWYVTAAKFLLILLMVAIIATILAAIHAFLGLIGYSVLFMLTCTGILYGTTSRFATAGYVISTIGYCVRQNLPLPMALETAAAGQKGKRSAILLAVKNWLIQGYALSDALKFGYPACPSDALAAITIAEKTNQLPSVLSSIEANMVARASDRKKVRHVHPFYPFIVIGFIFFLVLGITQFVLPTFTEVLYETSGRTSLPFSTRMLVQFSKQMDDVWPLFFLLLFILSPFAGIYSILTRFRTRRPQKPYLVSRLGDFVKWHTPILHWFEKNYSLVQTVGTLRISLNAGYPIDQAIKNTLDLDVNFRFKKGLQKWLRLVESGQDVSGAARESGLGKPLAWTFDLSNAGTDTPSMLETLETFYRSNYNYRVNLARFIFWPCVTVSLGLLVGFFAYAFFVPMVEIITSLVELI